MQKNRAGTGYKKPGKAGPRSRSSRATGSTYTQIHPSFVRIFLRITARSDPPPDGPSGWCLITSWLSMPTVGRGVLQQTPDSNRQVQESYLVGEPERIRPLDCPSLSGPAMVMPGTTATRSAARPGTGGLWFRSREDIPCSPSYSMSRSRDIQDATGRHHIPYELRVRDGGRLGPRHGRFPRVHPRDTERHEQPVVVPRI